MSVEAVLLVLSGPETGKRIRIPFGRDVVFGRRSDVDCPIPDGYVSRRHFKVQLTEVGLRLEDVGSSHGTLLNGEKIGAAVVLRHNDTIRAGITDFLVQLEVSRSDAKRAPAAPPAGVATVLGSDLPNAEDAANLIQTKMGQMDAARESAPAAAAARHSDSAIESWPSLAGRSAASSAPASNPDASFQNLWDKVEVTDEAGFSSGITNLGEPPETLPPPPLKSADEPADPPPRSATKDKESTFESAWNRLDEEEPPKSGPQNPPNTASSRKAPSNKPDSTSADWWGD